MAKHDFEDVLAEIKSIVSSNFNTKLSALETEKGDGITLPTVDSNAYFMQSMNDDAANFDPFIVYGIEDIQTDSIGYQSSEKIFVSVVILLSDNGRDAINEIMFRYSRALKEIFEENWQLNKFGIKINVTRSTVVPFVALDSSASYKAVGIEIEINLP